MSSEDYKKGRDDMYERIEQNLMETRRKLLIRIEGSDLHIPADKVALWAQRISVINAVLADVSAEYLSLADRDDPTGGDN